MISVIVPVYKAEQYLDKCVQSILAQTYTDFELILVDDGSPDICPQMCDGYAKMDERVRVIHKENGGPSEARNCAVKEALGETITFIDSDDVVHREYLRVLYELMEAYGCEISAVRLKLASPCDDFNKILHGDIKHFDGIDAVKNMLYQKDFDTSPCALLMKKDIVVNNPFPVGRFHEDDFTIYKYFLDAKKITLFKDVLYFYIQRTEGIMNSVGKVSYDEIDASNNLVDVFKEMNGELYRAAISKKFSNYCQMILKDGAFGKEDKDTYNELVSFVKSTKWKIICDNECRLKNRIAAASLIFGVHGLKLLNRLRK